MEIDHIFIFLSPKGEEVDDLVRFGLNEGSGRSHPGIGTRNRRVFFENFYLEFLWVENEAEAKSLQDLGIWERSKFRDSDYSPFGLCLNNTANTDSIFEDSLKFHPDFLPKGNVVDIITNEKMPWIFRFPPKRQKKNSAEPRVHQNGIKSLTRAVFNLQRKDFKEILDAIEGESIIEFRESLENLLVLEFDNNQQGKIQKFKELMLEIRY